MGKNDSMYKERYNQYCEDLKNLKCPNCRAKLNVTVDLVYDKADNLLSEANLLCENCNYTSNIVRKYSELVRTKNP